MIFIKIKSGRLRQDLLSKKTPSRGWGLLARGNPGPALDVSCTMYIVQS